MRPTSSFLANMRSNLLVLLTGCVVAFFVSAQAFPPTDAAWMGQLVAAAEAGEECLSGADMMTAGTDNTSFGNADNAYYLGQAAWTNASAVSICRVDVKMSKKAGDISGKTYTCRIWTMNGTSLDTEVGTSGGVTGNNAWNATVVTFTFNPVVELDAETRYAITVDQGASDASNYSSLYDQNTDAFAGNLVKFQNTKTVGTSYGTYEAQFDIFWMQ